MPQGPYKYTMLNTISSLLNIASSILLVLAFAILIYRVVTELLPLISSLNVNIDIVEYLLKSQLFKDIITTFIIIYILGIILKIISSYLHKTAINIKEDFIKLLIGYVNAYRRIDINTLASKLGEDPSTIERIIAELAMEGKFSGRIEGGIVIAGQQTAFPGIYSTEIGPPVPQISDNTEAGGLSDNYYPGTSVITADKTPNSETATPPEQGSYNPPTNKINIDKIIDELDIEELNKALQYNYITKEEYDNILNLINAYKQGVISLDAYKEVVREILTKNK